MFLKRLWPAHKTHGADNPTGGRPPRLLDGELEVIDGDVVFGWVIADDPQHAPARIDLVAKDTVLASTLADIERPDLLERGFAETVRGFCFDRRTFPAPPSIPDLSVKVAETGQPLRGSPLEWDGREALPSVDLSELTVTTEDAALPRLDRREVDPADLDEHQAFWRENGYLILERFIPDALTDAYAEARWRLRPRPESWSCPTVYMHVPECLALCCYGPLAAILEKLIGEPMGLHLNLTGWKSTDRNWHQDAYLNLPRLNDHYLAVWFALDDIHPDAGPFEYVPGSHHWNLLSAEKVKAQIPSYQRGRIDWPKLSEAIVVPAFEREIARQGLPVRQFIAKKGDVLIWHSRLLHRGSEPRDPDLLRKSLIAHYSAIGRRPGFPPAKQTPDGGWYFPIEGPLDP